MGEFLDLAAVLAPEDCVHTALAKLGSEARCYSAQPDRTLVVYDEATTEFSRMRALFEELSAAAFAFHIYDGDLWLYKFYVDGHPIDQFNSVPNYWEEFSPEEEMKWRGDADLLARHWMRLKADSIRLYLRDQTEVPYGHAGKAYPDDEFAYGDYWQFTDFLRKLGTPYPPSLDES